MRTLVLIWVSTLVVATARAEPQANEQQPPTVASAASEQQPSERRPGTATGPEAATASGSDGQSNTTPAELEAASPPATASQSEIDVHDEADSETASDLAGACEVEPVVLKRSGFGGPLALSLTTCDGEPSASALLALSQLAQPATAHATRAQGGDSVASLHQLNPGLLERLQRIADHYEGRAIELVSGYRPNARAGSRHRSGDALDLRVDGVDTAELSAFARSLVATGVGYYPNSGFVHIDVRKEAFYWVDSSGPGQAPHYKVALPTAALLDKVASDGTASNKLGAATQNAAKTAEDTGADGGQAATQSALDGARPPTQAELDAELRGLAERALVVMNAALGRATDSGSALPTRSDP